MNDTIIKKRPSLRGKGKNPAPPQTEKRQLVIHLLSLTHSSFFLLSVGCCFLVSLAFFLRGAEDYKMCFVCVCACVWLLPIMSTIISTILPLLSPWSFSGGGGENKVRIYVCVCQIFPLSLLPFLLSIIKDKQYVLFLLNKSREKASFFSSLHHLTCM